MCIVIIVLPCNTSSFRFVLQAELHDHRVMIGTDGLADPLRLDGDAGVVQTMVDGDEKQRGEGRPGRVNGPPLGTVHQPTPPNEIPVQGRPGRDVEITQENQGIMVRADITRHAIQLFIPHP